MAGFVRAHQRLIAIDRVTSIDTTNIDQLKLVIHHLDGCDTAEGPDAIEALMRLEPAVLEGVRLRWARRAWAVHNLVGHPLLQIFVWIGQRKLGMWIHEATVPRPRGIDAMIHAR